MNFRSRRRVDTAIDMTPMIDTLLQLFVVFLLSMSFVTSAVKLELPKASASQPSKDSLVTVAIDKSDQVYLNDEKISRADLTPKLRLLFKTGTPKQVLLRAEKSLLYEKIMETLVEIQQAGAENVSLAFDERP